MDINSENSVSSSNVDSQNVTYASVLSKAKNSSDDTSNNNPNLQPRVSFVNDQLQEVKSVISNENILDDNKNASYTNTSSSFNDSFEDAEDSQITSNGTDLQTISTASDVGELATSGPFLNGNDSQSNIEMNESNSSIANSNSESEEEERSDMDTLYPTALKWKFRSSNSNLNLPDTVTLLETEAGSKVYIVGTSHFSLESQEDVSKTIRAVQPDIVLVELCKSRVNMLSLDEATIMEEVKGLTFQKIVTTIEQNGMLQGVLYFLLLSMSAHLTKQLGMAPGGEFRRAYNEARQIPGCIVHLGDRPIHITLQRALTKLSLWQKIRIAWHLMRSKGPITKEEVERCKQKDLLEEMLAEMTGDFPELSEVFVKERDIFLVHSLQMAARPMLSPHATVTPTAVVGVVGIGHVPGIVEKWGKVKDEDIPPTLYVPEPSMSSKVIRHAFRLSLLGLGVYGLYRIFPRSLIPSRPRLSALFHNAF